jgi:hypothetical protein
VFGRASTPSLDRRGNIEVSRAVVDASGREVGAPGSLGIVGRDFGIHRILCRVPSQATSMRCTSAPLPPSVVCIVTITYLPPAASQRSFVSGNLLLSGSRRDGRVGAPRLDGC